MQIFKGYFLLRMFLRITIKCKGKSENVAKRNPMKRWTKSTDELQIYRETVKFAKRHY